MCSALGTQKPVSQRATVHWGTSSAWAVGYGNGQNPLFLRWNGARWRTVDVPAVGGNGEMTGIASQGNTLWAVGYSSAQKGGALIIRRG